MEYFDHAYDQMIMCRYNFQGNCSNDLMRVLYYGIIVHFTELWCVTDMFVMVIQSREYL